MCGRYTLTATPEELVDRFGITLDGVGVEALDARYDLGPSQSVPIVAASGDQHRLLMARWGFHPAWVTKSPLAPINARAETVATSRMFQHALKRARCLVPATGFYEWKVVPGQRRKQPYYLRPKGGGLFAFAGLYTPAETEPPAPPTCTIFTTVPNELAATIHDRMPVILEPGEYEAWLDPGAKPAALHRLLDPYPGAKMSATPVGRYVNSPKHEGPRCVEHAPDAAGPTEPGLF